MKYECFTKNDKWNLNSNFSTYQNAIYLYAAMDGTPFDRMMTHILAAMNDLFGDSVFMFILRKCLQQRKNEKNKT